MGMEDTVATYDKKIALVMATGGATEAEARRALEENGGDVDAAMTQRSGDKREEPTRSHYKTSGSSQQVGAVFSKLAEKNELEYTPVTERSDRIENGKSSLSRTVFNGKSLSPGLVYSFANW